MAFTALRFPEDIKWERLCATPAMMDRQVCDRKRPFRWRSSAALFGYEPPEEEQPYEDKTVSYLKVVATITGFQPDGDEIEVKDSDWETLPGIEDFEQALNEYYPCYGALLEVVVGPGKPAAGEEAEAGVAPQQVPLDDYPYIAAVEPSKRELYELVSETGERSSRSVEAVNVKAGATTTESTEVLDSLSGIGAAVPTPGGAVPVGVQGQWGTRSLSSTERVDVRTTDSMEELRNTLARTTNLTQMYSLLQSYHLGTNRALFVVQPRPHTVQSEFTFVNGPRELEGTQEILLVVVRPKEQGTPCVLVDFETAHLAFRPEYESATRTTTHELHVLAKAEDRGGSLGDDSVTVEVSDSSTYHAPSGWDIESWEYASVSGDRVEGYNVEFGPRFLTISGTVTWRFEDRNWGNQLLDGRLDVEVRITLKSSTPTQTGDVETLFLTGRRMCCCNGLRPEPPSLPDWIVGELDLGNEGLVFRRGPATPDALREARRAVAVLGRTMRELSTSPTRYPLGGVHFYQSDVFARRLSAHLRAHGAADAIALDERPPDRVVERFGARRKQPFTFADYLAAPARPLGRALGRDPDELRRERLERLTAALQSADAEHAD